MLHTIIRLMLAGVLAVSASGAADRAHATAADQLRALQTALVRDKSRKDWKAYLTHAQALRVLLNGAPLSELEVARAALNLSDEATARRSVAAFLAMGETHPILETPLFRPLHATIVPAVAANSRTVSAAALAFTFSDPRLLVEDIDYDAQTGRFFVTSVLERKIVVRDAKGRQTTFAATQWPLLALKIDGMRRRLWATEVALEGFDGVPRAGQGRSAVLEYNLDSARLLARIVPSFPCALGDLALAPDGTPLISDGAGGGVYRLRNGALQRIDRGEFISPQTIAVDGAADRLYVPDYVRGIAIMPLAGGAVRWLPMQDRYAIDGIDGLYLARAILLAVQNGTTPERVAAFALDRSRTGLVNSRIVEQRTNGFGDPTHGVVVGDAFYYIANSGWDKIDGHGRLKHGLAFTPARIMRIKLDALTGRQNSAGAATRR